MAKLVKKSPVPLYLAAAVWAVWALFAPMYAWWHFVLAAVCSDACLTTLSENRDAEKIDQKHLRLALEHVKARTNPELLKLYIEFNEKGKAKA